MKLLKQYYSLEDAEALSRRLEKKGIAIFISSRRSHNLGGLFTGAFKVGVWVILNHQYQDAIQLVANKRHEVLNPLTEDEIQHLKTDMKGKTAGALLFTLLKLIVLFVIIIGAVFYFLKK